MNINKAIQELAIRLERELRDDIDNFHPSPWEIADWILMNYVPPMEEEIYEPEGHLWPRLEMRTFVAGKKLIQRSNLPYNMDDQFRMGLRKHMIGALGRAVARLMMGVEDE
jgi:hypothetical protein